MMIWLSSSAIFNSVAMREKRRSRSSIFVTRIREPISRAGPVIELFVLVSHLPLFLWPLAPSSCFDVCQLARVSLVVAFDGNCAPLATDLDSRSRATTAHLGTGARNEALMQRREMRCPMNANAIGGQEARVFSLMFGYTNEPTKPVNHSLG